MLYPFILLSSSFRAHQKKTTDSSLKPISLKKTTSITFNPLRTFWNSRSRSFKRSEPTKIFDPSAQGRERRRERERDIQRPVFTVFTCPRGPVSGPVITRGRVGVIGSVRRPRPHMPPACLPAKTDEPRAIHIFPGFTAILPRLRGYRHSPSGRPLLCLLPVIAGSISGRGWPISISRRDRVRVLTSSVMHMEFLWEWMWRDEVFKWDVWMGCVCREWEEKR